MPDDIAKIGLDTADIARAIDRISDQLDKLANKHAKEADARFKTLRGTLITVSNAAKTLMGIAGFGGFIATIKSVKNLNSDLNETRSHLVAGSQAAKDFDKAIERGGGAGGLRAVKELSNWTDRVWAHIMLNVANVMDRIRRGPAGGVQSPSTEALPGAGIQSAEDALSKARAMKERAVQEVDILKEELKLEKEKEAYYDSDTGRDRERLNSSRERIAAIRLELRTLETQISDEKRMMELEGYAVEAKLNGTEKAIGLRRIELEWQQKIHAAELKFGKDAAEIDDLRAQRNLALMQSKQAQHNETSKERRDAKNAARKLNSDSIKQDRRDAELDRRILRGESGSPSSRLEERRRHNYLSRQQGVNAPTKPGQEQSALLANQMLSKIEENTRACLVLVSGGG